MNALPSAPTAWENTVRTLRADIPEGPFQAWIKPIEFQNYSDGVLVLGVPDSFSQNWVVKNFEEMICSAFGEQVGRSEVRIQYAIEPEHAVVGDADGADISHGLSDDASAGSFGSSPADNSTDELSPSVAQGMVNSAHLTVIPLNSDHTFENFIVGESNRFANAAAMAVADPQSRVYNPLFLYGGSGLGKTHLMQAIGHRLLSISRNAKVLYVTSEIFMNAFIQGVQQKDLNAFRNLFRNVDLLMIDDIHTLVGRERSQAEFFHTFNTLCVEGNKIVISSDVPPRQLTELEDRIRTRFQEGLIVDIQPPELETRVAILLRKARDRGIELMPEVAIFIAERITSSVRELEGALERLQLHQRMDMGPVTIDVARTLLKDHFGGQEPVKISVEKIQSAVCNYFGISMHELTGANRSRKYTVPRHIASYLSRELTSFSFPELARKFGGRDHTSIMHSHRKIQQELASDLNKQNLIRHLTRVIKDEPSREGH